MYAFVTSTEPMLYEQSLHQLSPQTPLPSRTSHNANPMIPPRWPPGSPLDSKSSPLTPYAPAQQAPLFSTPQPRRASTPSAYSSLSSPSSLEPSARSTFASRSRASTPHATLSAQNAAARDHRKSLFRDRIRKQRDDARFDSRADQVLRMDFVRERRAWEERVARSAPADLDVDEDIESTEDVEVREDGMVPLTEEDEIEALAQYMLDNEVQNPRLQEKGGLDGNWEEQGQRQQLHGPSASWCGGHMSCGSDEEDYDQLFMEMISHSEEQGDPRQEPAQQQQCNQDLGFHRISEPPTSSMDLS